MTRCIRRFFPSEGMSLVIKANFSQASSCVRGIWLKPKESIPPEGDDRWFITPFQVADGRHQVNEIFDLIRRWGC